MDFNQFNQNPMLKRGMTKISMLIFACLFLEIAAFVGVSYLIGFSYAFWLTIGFMIVGYAIRPSAPVKKDIKTAFSARKMASTLLMVPGFLTDIAAVVVLIGPLRRLVQRQILKRLLPPGMAELFNGDMMNNLNRNLNLDGMNPDFSGFADFQAKTDASDASKKEKKKRRKKKDRSQSDAVIDVDYDIEYDGRTVQKKSSDYENSGENKMKKDSSVKALEAEILDVEYEWESK